MIQISYLPSSVSQWIVDIHQVVTAIFPVDNSERLAGGGEGNSYGDIKIHRLKLTFFDKLLLLDSFSLRHRDRWLSRINLLNAYFLWSVILICLRYLNFLNIDLELLSLVISY